VDGKDLAELDKGGTEFFESLSEPLRRREFRPLRILFSPDQVKPDFHVRFDVETLHDIPESILKEDGNDLAITLGVLISASDGADAGK